MKYVVSLLLLLLTTVEIYAQQVVGGGSICYVTSAPSNSLYNRACPVVYDVIAKQLYINVGSVWVNANTPSDNLGNHTATQDISLAGNKLEKLSFPTSTSTLLEVATHKQKFGSGELVTAVTPTNFQITGPGGAGLYASSSSLLQLRLSSTEQYQFSTVGMTLPTQTGIANVSGTLAWNATRMRVRKGSDIEELAYVTDAKLSFTTMSSAGNVPAGTELLLVDASNGAMGVSLPPASTWVGNTIIIKKIDATSNTVFISEANGVQIDGFNTTQLGQPYKTVTIANVGTQLLITN